MEVLAGSGLRLLSPRKSKIFLRYKFRLPKIEKLHCRDETQYCRFEQAIIALRLVIIKLYDHRYV